MLLMLSKFEYAMKVIQLGR